MNKILIIFASRNGHTKKIADDIAIILEDNKIIAELCNIDVTSPIRNLKNYKHILVMSPVYNKQFMNNVVDFVTKNHDELNKIPSTFIGICLSIIKSKENNFQKNRYVINFLKRTKWNPSMTFMLAGRLYYQDYGLLEKISLKIIMLTYGQTIRTNEPVIFTDSQKVKDIAHKIVNF